MIGKDKKVTLIDYGYAKRFLDDNNNHFEKSEVRGF